MDLKMIIPGVLLIGGAIFFLQPEQKEAHEAVVDVPKSAERQISDAIVRGSTMGGRRDKPYDGSNPEVLRRKELAGMIFYSPALARGGNEFGIVTKVLSGITADSPGGMPAALAAVPAPTDCNFTRPSLGDQVAGVHTYDGGPVTNAHAYTEATVTRAALRGLREQKSSQGRKITDNGSIIDVPETGLRQIDVVVNMPGTPVFLTLQDRGGGVLWNLQVLPGTSLSHVTLLSGGHSAVANLPEGVAVQGASLSASDSCSRGAYPVEPPPASAGKREGYSITSQTANMQRLRDTGFGGWFATTFGYESAVNMVAVGGAAHVLLGAMPGEDAAPVPYRPLAGSTLQVIPAPLTYVSTPAEHETWLRSRAVQLLAAAYGVAPEADLGTIIRSANQERIR